MLTGEDPGDPHADCVRSLRVLHDGDVRQVAISFGEVQAVTHDELVGNLEPKIIDRHFFLAPLKLVEQRRKLHACRPARFQIGQQVTQREPRVDDVFDDDDVAAFDGDVQIFQDADLARGAHAGAVTRYCYEFNAQLDVGRAN